MSDVLLKLHWRPWLLLGVSLFGLNLALSFHNVWPTPWVTTRHEISVEAAALLFLMALLAEWRHPPSRRVVGWLAAAFTVLTLGRYAEVTAPALYGRPVNLFWDAQHLPRVAAMLAEASPGWLVAASIGGAAMLFGGVFLALRWMFATVVAQLSCTFPRRFVMGLTGGLVALYVASYLSPHAATLRWFSVPVTWTYAEQMSFLHLALAADHDISGTDAVPLAASGLERVAGADVMFVFLESYGATSFDRSEYALALARSRADLKAAVARSGRQAVSAYVRSPTFGGVSWLAHASFLSGVEVADTRLYELLLTRKRETLVHRFARHGYRTVALMPGLRQPWPEGDFYDFDKIYDAATLTYPGPAFGWWSIPDQYALARFDTVELAPQPRAPVMLFFPTISSHLPFRPTPPYQADWQALLGPRPFDPDGVAERLAQNPEWTNLGPAYVDSLDYALTYLAGYLEQGAPADVVLIVLGDHQPAASVSGKDAPWDVPVHVIASRPALIQALRSEGFQSGLEPLRPVIGSMHELTAKVLRAFGDDTNPGDSGAEVQPGIDVAGSGSRS